MLENVGIKCNKCTHKKIIVKRYRVDKKQIATTNDSEVTYVKNRNFFIHCVHSSAVFNNELRRNVS